MAIEKILQTRIQLRYDEYTNWYNNNPVLKRGEIAIATIPENHTNPSTGEITQIPAVVMKVGTGAETGSNYRDLPFVSAKAADVLAACKSEASLRTFVNGVIADAGIASSDAMEALAGRVTGTENDIKTLKGDENTAGSVAKAIKDAIDALNLADTYQAKGDYATKTELGDVDAKFVNYKTAADQKVIDDEQDRRLGVIEGDYLKAADIVNFETKDNVALKADKSVVEAMYTNTQIDGFIAEAKKYADDNDADTKYGIVYDSDNKKIKLVEGGSEVEIDATDFIKDGMIETVTIGDDNDLVITFNTAAGKENIVLPLDQLVDIYTGVEGARVKVTVASDKSISADLVAGSISKNYLDGGVQTSLGKADTAIQQGDLTTVLGSYYTKTEADAEFMNSSEVDAKIEALELGTMSKETADNYVKKTDAPGYGDILTKTDAQGLYQAKGEYYTKSEADAEFTNATEVDGQIDAKITALDLANTYQAKGEYATAEQGGKADTALQEITTTANGGLKVTNKNQIDIDEDIIFVFDCGDSGINA